MAGVGQADLPVVSAGVQAEPLVTPANTQVQDSAAVTNMVDAFRKGFVTQDDIVSRIGEQAQAEKKATLQKLGEYVSPGAIEARQNELSLSNPETEAKRWALERSKWNTVFSGGVDAFQQYGPWFGHSDVPTKADGTPDFSEMGKIGQTFRQPLYMYELAQQGLTPDPARTLETKDPNGKTGKRIFNHFGREITPGSPGEAYYQSLMQGLPGKSPLATPAPKQAMPALSATGAPPPTEGGTGTETSTGGFDPNVGVVTGSATIADTRSNILDKNQAFKIWEGNKANIDSFHNIVHLIKTAKTPQQRLEAERGLVYTLSELQQNQAQGSIPRSVIGEWEKIVARAPLTDQIKNIIGKTTGSHPLTESQVDSLITLGKQQIAGKASGALSGIELAGKQNPQALLSDEKRMLETGGQSEVLGERASAMRGKGKTTEPTKGTPPPASTMKYMGKFFDFNPKTGQYEISTEQ